MNSSNADLFKNYFLNPQIEKVVPHEGFNFNLDNNLAAIKLKRVIEFDDFVQPICLPERNKDITDESIGKVRFASVVDYFL